MTSPSVLSKQKILDAIEKHYGIIADVANQFKVTRQAIYKWVNADAEIKAAVELARENLVDLAESSLIKRIREGDTTAIIFTLKTQGKRRGYIERQEITGADGNAIEIKTIDYRNQLDTIKPDGK